MALGAWRSASGWRRLISVQRRALPLRPAVLRAPFAAHITLPPPTAALVGSRPRGLVPAARFGTASNTTNNDPSMPAADGAEPGQLPAAAFTGLGFDQEFTPVLADMGVRQPTPIQQASAKLLLSDKDVFLAAETGSGKTLAYLLPLIQRLRRHELHGGERLGRRPRALVLLPNRDLAHQVLSVAKTISHTLPFRAVGVIGGSTKGLRKKLEDPVDLVVATPGTLNRARQKGDLHLSRVQTVVVDEADSLLDDSFVGEVLPILQACKPALRALATADGPSDPGALRTGRQAQIVVVGATIRQQPLDLLKTAIRGMRMVSTDRVHSIPPTIGLRFQRVDGGSDVKLRALCQLIVEGKSTKYLVFCNKATTARWLAKSLEEHEIASDDFSAHAAQAERKERLAAFASSDATRVLVATDAGSRGLDVPGLDHVVMYDFPDNSTDFLHRAGRTGRAGNRGRVTVFVTRSDATQADRIRSAIRKNRPLPQLANG